MHVMYTNVSESTLNNQRPQSVSLRSMIIEIPIQNFSTPNYPKKVLEQQIIRVKLIFAMGQPQFPVSRASYASVGRQTTILQRPYFSRISLRLLTVYSSDSLLTLFRLMYLNLVILVHIDMSRCSPVPT